MDQRRRYGLLDFYGSEYLPPVGQDSADVISTDPRMARQPQRFGRWQPDVLASGEAAKAGVFGKALGLLGLDADGNRAATSWTDAAKHTAGNVINIPQDVGNQLLALQDYQPAYGTGAVDDKGLAARQAASTFGLAGLAPMGGVLAGRGAARNPVAPVIPELKGRPELPRQAAFEYQGQTFEGPIHGSALAMAEDWFGPSLWDDWKQPNGWQTAREGYVTTSGRFVTRKEADDLLRQSGLLNYERLNDSEHFALHSSELNDLRSKRHELFSANPKEAAVPRMVVQGFRGYNPDHGIGPGVDRPQVVWATPDKGLADIFGRNTVTAPVEMRFNNPYVIDAKGARFDNVPVREGKGLLSYLAPTVRHHIDDLALDKRDAGHDGMIVKNVRETGKDNVARTADQLVALRRGTVFDPASGDLLWANSKEGAVPGLLAQGENASKTLTNQGRNANMYDPPIKSQRPFEADYPGVANHDNGRLTHDMDGRPLTAQYVVGRRALGGADEALPAAQLDALSEAYLGTKPAPASRKTLGGDAGQLETVTDRRSGVTTRQIHFRDDLPGPMQDRVIAHEHGHGIDNVVGGVRQDGIKKQLSAIFNDLNNPSQSAHAKPFGADQLGYKGAQIPAENMAEAVRAYLQNPNYIKTVAPEAAARIRAAVNSHPKLSKIIQFNANPEGGALPGAVAQEPLTPEERRAAAYRAGLAREAFRLLQPSGAR